MAVGLHEGPSWQRILVDISQHSRFGRGYHTRSHLGSISLTPPPPDKADNMDTDSTSFGNLRDIALETSKGNAHRCAVWIENCRAPEKYSHSSTGALPGQSMIPAAVSSSRCVLGDKKPSARPSGVVCFDFHGGGLLLAWYSLPFSSVFFGFSSSPGAQAPTSAPLELELTTRSAVVITSYFYRPCTMSGSVFVLWPRCTSLLLEVAPVDW